MLDAVKQQAKVLEIFIREIIVSTEIGDIELPFDKFHVHEFGLDIKNKKLLPPCPYNLSHSPTIL